MIVFWKGGRRPLAWLKERLERFLDQAIGLASSEPTRQAVLQSGDKTLLLFDITDQVTLTHDSLKGHKTLREFALRKRTGASVVAIYREGQHMANPGPDIELHPHDVLVIMGEKGELSEARKILIDSL